MGTPAGYPDWRGNPAVHGFANVINTTGQVQLNVPVNERASMSRPGYLTELKVWNETDSVTQIPCVITVTWTSSITGLEMRRQSYKVLVGTVAAPHVIQGKGPVESGNLTITLQNKGPIGKFIGFSLSVDETSEAPVEHDWHTNDNQPATYPGWAGQISTSDLINGTISQGQAVVQGGNSETLYLMPLYSGRATLWAFTTANVGSSQFGVQQVFGDFIPGNVWVATVNPPAAGQITEMRFPRNQCAIDIDNQAAGAINAYWSITARRM